eukprot:9928885-Heterocapsa_arctica.AAC.1
MSVFPAHPVKRTAQASVGVIVISDLLPIDDATPSGLISPRASCNAFIRLEVQQRALGRCGSTVVTAASHMRMRTEMWPT